MPTIAQAQAKLGAKASAGLGVSRATFVPKNDIPLALQMVAEYIEEFERQVSDKLNKLDKVDTGSLESSINFQTAETTNGIIIQVFVNDYYKFIDKGVQGTGPGNKNSKSPYKYRDKAPPVVEILKWIRRNVNAARNESQQRKLSKLQKKRRSIKAATGVMKPKTLAFLISRKIKRVGLPYTGFWERSINETFKDFDAKMSQALGIDIRVNLENMVKEIKSR